MELKENFQNRMWDVVQVYLMAKEGVLYSHYFHYSPNEEERFFANHDSHIRMMRHMIWHYGALELYKVVSQDKNDYTSLKHIINDLKPTGKLSELKCSYEKIKEWDSELKKHKKFLNKLHIARNKIFAHTDQNRKQEENKISIYYHEAFELMNSIEIIIKGIYSEIYNVHYILEAPTFKKGKNVKILEILLNNQKKIIGKK